MKNSEKEISKKILKNFRKLEKILEKSDHNIMLCM